MVPLDSQAAPPPEPVVQTTQDPTTTPAVQGVNSNTAAGIATEKDLREKAPQVWDLMLQGFFTTWKYAQDASNDRIKQYLRGR